MSDEPFTRMTIEDRFINVSIEVPREGMTLSTLMDDVVMQLLAGAGYSEKTIEQYFNERESE